MAAPRSVSSTPARQAVVVARALVGAARAATLYAPDHPSARAALERLAAAVGDATRGESLTLGIAPDALLLDGEALPGDEVVAEAAAYLHQRDVLRLAFTGRPPADALGDLLSLLAEDISAVRARGGIAAAWVAHGRLGIEVEAIDYQTLLGDTEQPIERKDDLWRTLVKLATLRHATLDEAAERRLLEIAADPEAMSEFADDIRTDKTTPDGAALVTSQAAAVLAAWRHLNSLVSVLAPDRKAEVMRNISTATSAMPSHVIVEILRQNISDQSAGDPEALAFDEIQVAQLLATALALGGTTSPRLAEVFDTIAPDEPRKRRILTMTRTLLNDTDFGRRPEFDSLWMSVEELLLAYNDTAFVSEGYRASLDAAGDRAARMAADVPPEWDEWMDSLGEESVRSLSALLLVDLLGLETDDAALTALASDLGALAEDLLMSGDFKDAATVVTALAARPCEATRRALDEIGASTALGIAAELIGDFDEAAPARLSKIALAIGPASVVSLSRALLSENARAQTVAGDIIVSIGPPAIPQLAPLVSSDDARTRRMAARMLGRLGTAESVPLLQPLLRGRDPGVAREAVRALSSIDDPAAARAVQTVLRAAEGPMREAIVAALVAERDPRVVPVLSSVLQSSDPAGRDVDVVLDTLKAVGILDDARSVPAIDAVMRRTGWLGRRKLRQVKAAAIATLQHMSAPEAAAAIRHAAATGDMALRRFARDATGGARG